MKKLLAVLMTCAMVFSLAACGADAYGGGGAASPGSGGSGASGGAAWGRRSVQAAEMSSTIRPRVQGRACAACASVRRTPPARRPIRRVSRCV